MADKEKDKKTSGGLFKKLSSLVFEETETTEVSKETSETTQSTQTTGKGFVYSDSQAGTSNPQVNLSIPNANGIFDQKFYNHFLEIIEENNIEGVDYFEFSKAKKAMDGIPGMAEAVKYQSAFASLSANSKITKEHLLKTADFYIEKLDVDAKEFENERDSEIKNQVQSRIDQAKTKEGQIASKQEEIAKLQAEINNLQVEIGQLNVEAQQYQFNIDATAKNFKTTLEAVKAQINSDKQNIQNFIQ